VPPHRLVTAEAVLKPLGNPRDLAAKVVSAPFLTGVAGSRAGQAGLRWERDPAAWLAARLNAAVDPDRGTVTLRLEGCPRRGAVSLLSAVVEAYKADALGQGRGAAQLRERDVLVRFVLAQQVNAQAGVAGAIQLNESTFDVAALGPSKATVDKSVLRAPRVVQPLVPGMAAPAK
jgi:hypothetical protein